MAETTRAANGKFAAKPKPTAGNDGESGIASDDAVVGSDDGVTVIDPKTIGESAQQDGGKARGDKPKRGRGRPKGFSPGKEKAKEALDLKALNSILFSCHSMLAAICKTPELELGKEESENLANATANVAKHYDITASEKALDWGNLCLTLGVVYGPRFVMINARRKEERAAKRAGASSVVLNQA